MQYIDVWDIFSAEKFLEENRGKLDNFSYSLMAGELAFYRGRYREAYSIFKDLERFVKLSPYHTEIFETAENLLSYEEQSTSIETENFIIRYVKDKDFPLASYIGDVLEAQFRQLKNIFPVHQKNKILVEIMPDIQTFALASPLREIEIRKTGTVGLCKYAKIMIVSPRLYSRGYHWASTAGHELVHYFEKRTYGDSLPLWLNEGVAKYFENMWRKALNLSERERDFLLVLKNGWGRGIFVSFDEMYPSIAKLPSGDHAGVAFAEVESFVSYFIEKYGQAKFFDLLSAISFNGGDIKRAVNELLGIEFSELEKGWREETNKRLSRVKKVDIPLYPQLKYSGKSENEEEEIDYSKTLPDYYRLGNLLYKKGYFLAASHEYKKALTDPANESLALYTKTGLALMKANRYSEALVYFKKAIDLFPGFFTPYWRAGEVLAELKRWRDALLYLVEANFINPYHPGLHEVLQKCYEESGDIERVERERSVHDFIIRNILR
uniref:Hypothetical conserved protein n=1 Tax=uncultured prokaryote TaxID=198431 RepID=H5SPY1_9ZZZZ|nr:hypothetical conserved protein [uncultured prokaryote]